jgi:hypothetical protein
MIRDVYDFFISLITVIFGIFISVFISNSITSMFVSKNKVPKDNHILIILLIFHLSIIFCFIILIKYILDMIILNPLILSSSFNFIGPTIALSSLYFSQTIKYLLGNITYVSRN